MLGIFYLHKSEEKEESELFFSFILLNSRGISILLYDSISSLIVPLII